MDFVLIAVGVVGMATGVGFVMMALKKRTQAKNQAMDKPVAVPMRDAAPPSHHDRHLKTNENGLEKTTPLLNTHIETMSVGEAVGKDRDETDVKTLREVEKNLLRELRMTRRRESEDQTERFLQERHPGIDVDHALHPSHPRRQYHQTGTPGLHSMHSMHSNHSTPHYKLQESSVHEGSLNDGGRHQSSHYMDEWDEHNQREHEYVTRSNTSSMNHSLMGSGRNSQHTSPTGVPHVRCSDDYLAAEEKAAKALARQTHRNHPPAYRRIGEPPTRSTRSGKTPLVQ